MIRRREVATAGLLVVLFAAAPTPGDVGGCGREVTPLDARAFAAARADVDCRRCRACGLETSRCARACLVPAGYVTFPATCQPLLHDGAVCLRALEAASCDAYAGFVADEGRVSPTECAFCRVPDDAGATP